MMSTSQAFPLVDDTKSDNVDATRSTAAPIVPVSRIRLNSYKAGMEGIDNAKINQIILNASKGSKFYENELLKEQQVTKRVNSMLESLKALTPTLLYSTQCIVDQELKALEATRNISHIVVHIDMDAFYAAVEMKNNPKLEKLPMAVGSMSMLSTSNYLARRYGVRAAMPGYIAKRLCPDLVIVEPHYDQYRDIAGQVRDVLTLYDPEFSPVGLDEAYFDLTDYVKCRLAKSDECIQADETTSMSCDDGTTTHPITALQSTFSEDLTSPSNSMSGTDLSPAHWQCAEAVVEEIRSEIFQRTGLTASAGIAPNKLLAKVASDMNKPNGQYIVNATREGILQFVQELPIRKISGIGRVTERMLNALGISKCGDLYVKRAVLHLLFSQTASQHFQRISLGIGSPNIHNKSQRKSMSTERTFLEINDPTRLLMRCQELCSSLAEEMKEVGIKGHTVTLKIKTVNFEVKSRSVTVPKLLSSEEELFHFASEMLRSEIKLVSPDPLRLRLMGVRISSLNNKQDKTQHTLEDMLKYGTSKTGPADNDMGHNTSDDETTDILTESSYCPVCSTPICSDNIILNAHIDECLNHFALQEAALHDGGAGTQSTISTCDLVEIEGTTTHKQSRKRKIGRVNTVQEHNSKKMLTLDKFLKSKLPSE